MLYHNDKYNKIGFQTNVGQPKNIITAELDNGEIKQQEYLRRQGHQTDPGVNAYLAQNLKGHDRRDRVLKKKKGIDYGYLVNHGGIEKETPQVMLNRMKQSEFMEVFYANLIVQDVRYNSIETKAREKVELKRLLQMIAKRKGEIKRYEEIVENPRTLEDERIQIKGNVNSFDKSIWHLRKQVSVIVEKLKVDPNRQTEFLAEDNGEDVLERIDYDIAEYEVDFSPSTLKLKVIKKAIHKNPKTKLGQSAETDPD